MGGIDRAGAEEDESLREFLHPIFLPDHSLLTVNVKVTGGFKTVGAMVSALDAVDGVGLGRPACQEPRLPHDILSGKIKGAIKMGFDEDDFGSTVVAAGTHIGEIGKDQEPLDLSREENLQGYMKDFAAFREKMAQDTEMREQAYVDVKSVPLAPYGSVGV